MGLPAFRICPLRFPVIPLRRERTEKLIQQSTFQYFLNSTTERTLVRVTCNASPSAMVGSGQPPS